MQSSWQRIAREAFRCSGRANFRPFRPLKNLKTPFISSQRRSAHATAAAQAQESSSVADEPSSTGSLEETCQEQPLTHSRIAFEAANAIRLAVSQGNLPDAYLILNSVHYAKIRSSSSPLMTSLLSLLPHNAFNAEAIPFSPQTPTRLVTHSLLHSLLRYGYLKEASRLSEELMKNNIKIHWASLDAVFKALTDPSLASDSPPGGVSPKLFTGKHTILSTTPIPEHYFSHQGGSYALRLLNVARQSRQQRTRGMFKALIALCIINGEIIMASLLFGLMVKDWNARVLELGGTQGDPPPRPNSEEKVPVWAASVRHSRLTAWPSESRLEEILEHIEEILRVRDHRTEQHQQAALQALANLAVLLDRRMIPFEHVSSLIRMLVRARSHEHDRVHVPRKDGKGLEKVSASAFFRSVLLRLCDDLPLIALRRHASMQPPHPRNKGFLPALDANSYNHLLRFALMHEQSTALAEKILHHMMHVRQPVLQCTHAIVERFREAAIRMESEEVWKMAHDLERWVTPSRTTQSAKERLPLVERYGRLLDWQKSPTPVIMTRIDFLVKSGNADRLESFIHSILPGYGKRKRTEEEMRLAVSRGPRVFVSILNGLAKTFKPHDAERIWDYARAVEAFSWRTPPDPANNILPWTLPIQAYTIMLQIYAKASRRGKGHELGLMEEMDEKGRKISRWVFVPKVLVEPNSESGTRSRTKRREDYIRFLQFTASMAREKAMTIYWRAKTAYEQYAPMANELLSSASSDASQANPERRKRNRVLHPAHELPAPDALFYNSILEIIGNDSAMPARIPVRTLDQAECDLQDAKQNYRMSGALTKGTREDLLVVGRDMLNGGFPIPPGLRPHFVGSGLRCEEDEEGGRDSRKRWIGRSVFKLRVGRKRQLPTRRQAAPGNLLLNWKRPSKRKTISRVPSKRRGVEGDLSSGLPRLPPHILPGRSSVESKVSM